MLCTPGRSSFLAPPSIHIHPDCTPHHLLRMRPESRLWESTFLIIFTPPAHTAFTPCTTTWAYGHLINGFFIFLFFYFLLFWVLDLSDDIDIKCYDTSGIERDTPPVQL